MISLTASYSSPVRVVQSNPIPWSSPGFSPAFRLHMPAPCATRPENIIQGGRVNFTLHDISSNLVHVGALLYLVCFLFRDQIWLRSFAIAGDVVFTFYYYNVTDQPLWGAIFWNIPAVAINLAMIYLILRDGRTTNFTENELRLFRKLPNLAPADFRKIVRLGKWETARSETVLAEEGQPLELLHYVLDGAVEITKGGRHIPVRSGLFIGEVAFLKDRPASATVRVKPGALFMSWRHTDLWKAQDKNMSLATAIGAMLNADMAEKVARS
jgi:Popeye protein conserved region